MYFGKAKDVVGDLRSKKSVNYSSFVKILTFAGVAPLTDANREKATHQEMINSMSKR